MALGRRMPYKIPVICGMFGGIWCIFRTSKGSWIVSAEADSFLDIIYLGEHVVQHWNPVGSRMTWNVWQCRGNRALEIKSTGRKFVFVEKGDISGIIREKKPTQKHYPFFLEETPQNYHAFAWSSILPKNANNSNKLDSSIGKKTTCHKGVNNQRGSIWLV